MKYLSAIFVTMAGLLTACNTGSQKTATAAVKDTAAPEMKIMVPRMVCYAGVVGKDSVFLKTEIFPNVVTGSLAYNFEAKDDSKGDIDGKLSGDTLIANYSFMAEGKSSVREIAFLLTDSSAIEGYGAMEEKNGTMVFTNKAGINFGEGFVLHVISCPQQ